MVKAPAPDPRPLYYRRTELGQHCAECSSVIRFSFADPRSGRLVWVCSPCQLGRFALSTRCCWCGEESVMQLSSFQFKESYIIALPTCAGCIVACQSGLISKSEWETKMACTDYENQAVDEPIVCLEAALTLGKIAFE